MGLAKGVRLGQYEVLEILGKGGMGEVCKERGTRLNRLEQFSHWCILLLRPVIQFGRDETSAIPRRGYRGKPEATPPVNAVPHTIE